MKTDTRVDAYIAKAQPFAQPILTHLRALVHKAVPEVVETMKWSMPFYTAPNGKIFANMSAFKAHASFGIWHVNAVAELKAAGFKSEESMGSIGRVESMKDLPKDALLLKLLRLSGEAAAAGASPMKRTTPKQPKAPLPVPKDFAAALKKSKKAAATFEAFSPSCRREYLEWITDAKREETRASRIKQAVDWISEGKQRNWKYQNC